MLRPVPEADCRSALKRVLPAAGTRGGGWFTIGPQQAARRGRCFRCWVAVSGSWRRSRAAPRRGDRANPGAGLPLATAPGCTGTPSVVLEPGAGHMSSDLALITPAVAHHTRVCVYDRAGRGWGDPANTTQDAAQIATDLHTLLQRANEPGPYVLAGHSFGGLYALTFAARYPEEVARLVLVDSTAPASESAPAQPADADSEDTVRRISALASSAARLGLSQVVGAPTPSHLSSTVEEYLRAGSSVQQAAALNDFTDKPLVVLTAGSGSDPGWAASQEALATLSTNSVHRVVDGATHASLITDQQDAAATARSVLDVVTAVRTASLLTPQDGGSL